MVGGVVDGYECLGIDDGVLKLLHGSFLLVITDKGFAFAHEVDKRASSGQVVLDPDMHEAS